MTTLDDLKALALATTCEAWAERHGWGLRRQGHELVGPCPVHGSFSGNARSSDRFAINTSSDVWNCRHEEGGGDVISLVRHVEGCGYVEALERITGFSAPSLRASPDRSGASTNTRDHGQPHRPVGPARRREAENGTQGGAPTKADIEKARRDAARRRERQERYGEQEREKARKAGYEIWKSATPVEGGRNPVLLYLAQRGLGGPKIAEVAQRHLRLHPSLPYRARLKDGWATIHEGPAMLAAVQRPDGRFGAVHITWLAPALRAQPDRAGSPSDTRDRGQARRPVGGTTEEGAPIQTTAEPGARENKGKAVIIHPETGETLPSKKVRGSKRGGAIRLYTPRAGLAGEAAGSASLREAVGTPSGPTRLVVGEGIETTLTPLAWAMEEGTAYWCGVDLGNMAGRCFRDEAGRLHRDEPDLDDDGAFVPPDWCTELVMLGDADSEHGATYDQLTRAGRRAMALRPGLTAKTAYAAAGKDFNDLVMASRPAEPDRAGPLSGAPGAREKTREPADGEVGRG